MTYTELGQPTAKGDYPVEGLGLVMMDSADLQYAQIYLEKGYEPAYFVSPSPAIGRYVVVGRQRV